MQSKSLTGVEGISDENAGTSCVTNKRFANMGKRAKNNAQHSLPRHLQPSQIANCDTKILIMTNTGLYSILPSSQHFLESLVLVSMPQKISTSQTKIKLTAFTGCHGGECGFHK